MNVSGWCTPMHYSKGGARRAEQVHKISSFRRDFHIARADKEFVSFMLKFRSGLAGKASAVAVTVSL